MGGLSIRFLPALRFRCRSPATPPRKIGTRQTLGVEFVSIPTRRGTYETFARYKQRVEAAVLKSRTSATPTSITCPMTLNLPGRDQKIEEYKQYLPT